MKKLIATLALPLALLTFAWLAHAGPTTPTTLAAPSIQYASGSAWFSPTPMQIIGYDSSTQSPCIIGFSSTCSLAVGSGSAGSITLGPSQNGIGNVGGKTAKVCVTPTVTTGNAYGTNYVVGGLLHFTGLFTSTGSGKLQDVEVTIKDVESNGYTFFPFSSQPSATTWTDAAVANINAADIPKMSALVSLGGNTQMGTASIFYAYGLGHSLAPGTTDIYGILLANAALTNNFTGASDVQVCLKADDDL